MFLVSDLRKVHLLNLSFSSIFRIDKLSPKFEKFGIKNSFFSFSIFTKIEVS